MKSHPFIFASTPRASEVKLFRAGVILLVFLLIGVGGLPTTAAGSSYALTVSTAGLGSGTVNAGPNSGINCPGDCTETYAAGTTVTLWAQPDAGSYFAGWSGACTGVMFGCPVTMTAAKTVTAMFSENGDTTFPLHVAVSGPGTVTSTPAGIACGNDCDEVYSSGSGVNLTATPTTPAVFAGWGFGCDGISSSGDCVLSLNAAKTVTAAFSSPAAPLPSDLSLYDDFSVAPLAPARWGSPREVTQTVQNGKLVLGYSATVAANQRVGLGLNPLAPMGGLRGFQAELSLTAATPPPDGQSRVMVQGTFYNESSSPGNDMTGDVRGQIGLRALSTGVREIFYSVFRCTDATCTNSTDVLPPTGLGDAAVGTGYLVGIAWNGSQFTFSVGGTPQATYAPVLIGGAPHVPLVGLNANVRAGAAGSGPGSVTGTFDNVALDTGSGLTLYDAFDAPDARIDRTKWNAGDVVREVRNGQLVVDAYAAGATTWFPSLGVANPAVVTALAADVEVTVTSADPTRQPGFGMAGLQGRFYSTQATPTSGDADVIAEVICVPSPGAAGTLDLTFLAYRAPSSGPRVVLATHTFTTGLPLGQAPWLFLVWNPTTHVFTYGYDTTAWTFDPTPVAPLGNPTPFTPFKGFTASVNASGGVPNTALHAVFDNVAVNAAANPTPLTITTLTASPASPQPVGTPLTLTATVTGGLAPQACKWWVTSDNWATYAMHQDWGACTVAWTPTRPGSYQLGVWARSSGATADSPQATKALPIAITSRQTTVTLGADKPSPQPVGTTLTFTATPANGTAPYQAKWWVTTDNWQTWALLRDWGETTYAWTPCAPGAYQVGVWVRSNGNAADAPEATAGRPVTVTGPPVSVTLSGSLPAPQPVSTAITFTATPSGGCAPHMYKWWLTTDHWHTWSLLQDWTTSATLPWTPTVPASYQVGVWVRSSGTTADSPQATKGLAFTITAPPPPSITSLTADKGSPQVVGTALTLTAAVTGGTAPQSCKWWVTTDNWQTYSVLQEWQLCTNSVLWTPGTPGSYQIGVWARSSGSTADLPQATKGLAVSIIPRQTTVILTADKASPQQVGTTVTLTATPGNGTAPYSCKWWGTTDAWTTWFLLQEWQPCTTALPWTPSTPGSYQVGVWAKSSGNSADAPEATKGLAFTINAMSIALNAAPPQPRLLGTTVSLTSTVSGGIAPQQCTWWMTSDNWTTYTRLREWQACTNALVWTPAVPGSYQVGVWARSSGATADAPQGSAGLAYEVVPDIRGTYPGGGSATNAGCTNPIDNGVFPFIGSIAVPMQNVKNFNGTGTFSAGDGSVNITVAGTVAGTGQVSGTLALLGGAGATGTLPFTGTVLGKTLNITFAGQTQEEGVICNLTGNFTGTRP